MIELKALEEMFSAMRATLGSKVDGPLMWGYFFTDPSEPKLQKAAVDLTNRGYRFVGIHETDDGSTRVLHVERVETHSATSLFARNAEFYKFAEDSGLASYDGMDVGPSPA